MESHYGVSYLLLSNSLFQLLLKCGYQTVTVEEQIFLKNELLNPQHFLLL